MPEMLEVEYYRQLAETVIGRTFGQVDVLDAHCLAPPLTADQLGAAVSGRRLRAARRQGKLLLLDTSGPTVGLRFGMTGTLVVNGRPGVERLQYSALRLSESHVRCRFHLSGRGELVLVDPRRFGRVSLDPDVAALGPDAARIRLDELRRALAPVRAGGGTAVKARLLDQSKLAGLGNLLVDEILWQAGIDPRRPAGSLDDDDLRRLAKQIRASIRILLRRGGSHLGDVTSERRPGGVCPRDGAFLTQATVGGRTTWWCPAHQR